MSNSTQNEDTTVKVDYAFIPLDNTECPICGIRTFEHLHQEGTKPKDFVRVSERLPEASKTIDTHTDWTYTSETEMSRLLQQLEGMELISPKLRQDIERVCIETNRATRADARKEVIESINKLKKDVKKSGYLPDMDYNRALSDVLATLKEEQL